MSIEAMALVLHHSTASGSDKLVLLGIANHEGDGGAFPTIEKLARYANVSSRSVQHSIARLVKAGEVAVDYRRGGREGDDVRYRPNLYRVLVCCPPDCDGSTNHRSRGEGDVTPSDPGVKSDASRGEVQRVSGVKPTSQEPSIEPSINHSFSEWYSLYPRHVGKGAAERAYKAALKQAKPDAILSALRSQLPDLKMRQTQYVPYPATWLNQQRWLDEYVPLIDVLASVPKCATCGVLNPRPASCIYGAECSERRVCA